MIAFFGLPMVRDANCNLVRPMTINELLLGYHKEQ
jgi:hypothetical protein